MKIKNATVITAKCHNSKRTYGIRAEKRNGIWMFTWAFKMSNKMAKNEGYDKTSVSGQIDVLSEYPGCPECNASSFAQCGNCNKIFCYDGRMEQVTCPHCNEKLTMQTVDSFENISGGSF